VARDLLDIERVRRNFDRMRDPVPESVPDRLGDRLGVVARVPLDPFVAGRDALERVRREALATFPDRTEALVHFLDRAASLLERLEKLGPAPAEDPAELRAQLVEAVEHVEDLYEAFSQRGRR
jgi:hypothetical protein